QIRPVRVRRAPRERRMTTIPDICLRAVPLNPSLEPRSHGGQPFSHTGFHRSERNTEFFGDLRLTVPVKIGERKNLVLFLLQLSQGPCDKLSVLVSNRLYM